VNLKSDCKLDVCYYVNIQFRLSCFYLHKIAGHCRLMYSHGFGTVHLYEVSVMCCNTVGIVGEIDGEDVYIWTHKKLDIGYNGKHIVDVNLTSESKVKLQPNIQLKFTYEVFVRYFLCVQCY